MKRFTAIIISLFLILRFSPQKTAYAGENFAQIITDNAVLYGDSALSIPLFVLPYSYFVKVISTYGDYSLIEYMDGEEVPFIRGYVRICDLSPVQERPQTLFPFVKETINENCLAYKSSSFDKPYSITEGSSFFYYGTLDREEGNTFFFGYLISPYGDKELYYIPSSAINGPSIPTLAIITAPVEETTGAEETDDRNNNLWTTLQTVLIVAISVVAVCIVYLLFKPSKTVDGTIELDEGE